MLWKEQPIERSWKSQVRGLRGQREYKCERLCSKAQVQKDIAAFTMKNGKTYIRTMRVSHVVALVAKADSGVAGGLGSLAVGVVSITSIHRIKTGLIKSNSVQHHLRYCCPVYLSIMERCPT